MQVKSFLSQHRVACGVEAQSKKRALQILSKLIAEDIPDLDADEVFMSLTARERLGSTGLGKGVAIPHCRLKNCTETVGALMQLQTGVDYDAIDGNPVDLIFALMVPEEAHDTHLQVLAALVERLNKPDYLAALREASTVDDVYQAAISLD